MWRTMHISAFDTPNLRGRSEVDEVDEVDTVDGVDRSVDRDVDKRVDGDRSLSSVFNAVSAFSGCVTHP